MKLANKLLLVSAISAVITTSTFANSNADMIKEGEKVFHNKKMGNCIACHNINGKETDNPGSIGPKLTGLKYWDEKDLYSMIYEPYTTRSKIGAMPSFGKNAFLSDHQIKAIVAFLKTVE